MDASFENKGSGPWTVGPRVAVLLAAALAFLFTSATLLAPVLDARGVPGGGSLRMLCGPVCHQLPERSLTVAGLPMAACARCVGLYVGGTLGLLLFGLLHHGSVRIRPVWLAVAVAPTLLDAVAPWIGLPGLSNLPRFVLAVPTGVVLGVFLAVGVADLTLLIRERLLVVKPPRTAVTGARSPLGRL